MFGTNGQFYGNMNPPGLFCCEGTVQVAENIIKHHYSEGTPPDS